VVESFTSFEISNTRFKYQIFLLPPKIKKNKTIIFFPLRTTFFSRTTMDLYVRTYTYTGAIQPSKDADGYKIFGSDWKCRGFQYKVGGTFEMSAGDIELCVFGFHYCEHPINCLSYYSFSNDKKFAQVKDLGHTLSAPFRESQKRVTNCIKIDKEISVKDWLELCTVTITYHFNGKKYREIKYEKGVMLEMCTYDAPITLRITPNEIRHDRYDVKRYRVDENGNGTLESEEKWDERGICYLYNYDKGELLSRFSFRQSPTLYVKYFL
jgi:hypothetical protein